jgi:mitogen-activated protein kinase 1/3
MKSGSYDELYSTILEGEEFFIPRRYVLRSIIGTGSYGTVVSAVDLVNGKEVAIKKNKNIFPQYLDLLSIATPNKTPSQRTTKALVPTHRSSVSQLRVLREISILNFVENHPNIISLKELILPYSYDKFTDVYIVTDLMEADLRDILDSSQVLNMDQIKYLMYQLLSAVHYLHSADIVHRDIKPENCLVNSKCELKLCDFGLARGCDFEIDLEKKLQGTTRLSTNYVQTRPYRAPELLLNSQRVGKTSDIWAIGCIFAEMLNEGHALFDGSSTQDQIFKIIQVMGTPHLEDVHGSTAAIEFINRLAFVQPNDEWYLEMFPRHIIEPCGLDLLNKLLQFDYQKRITAEEALKHEFFAEYHSEPILYASKKFDFSFEKNLYVNDPEDIVTYGHLVKEVAYTKILDFHGKVKSDVPKRENSQKQETNIFEMKERPTVFNKIRDLFKRVRSS